MGWTINDIDMLNYRYGQGVGAHSDAGSSRQQPGSPVVSLSMGSSMNMQFTVKDTSGPGADVELADGNVFILDPITDHNYQHRLHFPDGCRRDVNRTVVLYRTVPTYDLFDLANGHRLQPASASG